MGLITDFRGIVSSFRVGLLHILATKLHYLLVLGILSGIAFTIIIHRPDFAVRGLILFIPAALVSFLIYRGHIRRTRIDGPLVVLKINHKLLKIAFTILFTLSLFAISLSSYRPWFYFLLMTALFGIIFLQIFNENSNPYSILFGISCVMGNLIFGLQLKYPFFFGFSDIIPHLYYSKITLLSGHTIPIDLDSTYANFPLFHIFIAIGKSILGVDEKFAFIILTSISFIVLIWVIYLLANQLQSNTQLSLLICLVFATTPIVITYSTYVVTRVMAFIGFIYLIFLAQRKIRASRSHSFYLLLSIMSVYIILVHQVSILQIIPLLVIIYLLEEFVGDYVTIEPKILALITVAFSAYWVYISTLMSELVLTKTESINAGEIQQVRSQIQVGNEYLFLWNNIDIAITIFLVLVGIAFLVWAYKCRYPSVIGIFALIMIPFYFPSPITASGLAMITFRMDRLVLLVAPFFAIIIGIGLMLLLAILYQNRHTRIIGLFCGLMIFSILCFSAMTEDNASDCVDLSSNQSRVYFTQPEMNAFDFVTHHVTYGSAITSDRYAGRIFENRFFSKTQMLGIPFFNPGELLASSDHFSFSRGIYIFRSEEFERNGLRSDSTSTDYGDTIEPTSESIGKFHQLSDMSQRVFDNRGVVVYSSL